MKFDGEIDDKLKMKCLETRKVMREALNRHS